MSDQSKENRQTIAGGIMVCHPPLIVPRIGRGEEKKIEEITTAYKQAADEIIAMKPDTVVIISPHAPGYIDYIQITSAKTSRGNFAQFGDPNDSFEIQNDSELVREMSRIAKDRDFAMGTLGSQNKPLDHGTMVPLYFLKDLPETTQIVRMSIGGLSNFAHYQAGEILAQAAKNLGRTIAIIASGDLSHCQKEGTHYGFKPCGPEYDSRIMKIMGDADFESLVLMPEKEAEEAMSCGHKSFCIMAGAMDGLKPKSQALAHSAEFGVGYGICTYTDLQDDPSRKLDQKLQEKIAAEKARKRAAEDEYVSLARETVERYIKTGTVPLVSENLPGEMLDRQAGVFVSIHEFGSLRGCIGTILPVRRNIAAEIMHNAVSACSNDPRFPSIREDELDDLEISVDVLTKPEPCSAEDLDPSRYGVIVSSKGRRGVLLPDLDGVDTVSQQIAIAREKAGIPAREKEIQLERFEVVRHL